MIYKVKIVSWEEQITSSHAVAMHKKSKYHSKDYS